MLFNDDGNDLVINFASADYSVAELRITQKGKQHNFDLKHGGVSKILCSKHYEQPAFSDKGIYSKMVIPFGMDAVKTNNLQVFGVKKTRPQVFKEVQAIEVVYAKKDKLADSRAGKPVISRVASSQISCNLEQIKKVFQLSAIYLGNSKFNMQPHHSRYRLTVDFPTIIVDPTRWTPRTSDYEISMEEKHDRIIYRYELKPKVRFNQLWINNHELILDAIKPYEVKNIAIVFLKLKPDHTPGMRESVTFLSSTVCGGTVLKLGADLLPYDFSEIPLLFKEAANINSDSDDDLSKSASTQPACPPYYPQPQIGMPAMGAGAYSAIRPSNHQQPRLGYGHMATQYQHGAHAAASAGIPARIMQFTQRLFGGATRGPVSSQPSAAAGQHCSYARNANSRVAQYSPFAGDSSPLNPASRQRSDLARFFPAEATRAYPTSAALDSRCPLIMMGCMVDDIVEQSKLTPGGPR